MCFSCNFYNTAELYGSRQSKFRGSDDCVKICATDLVCKPSFRIPCTLLSSYSLLQDIHKQWAMADQKFRKVHPPKYWNRRLVN